MPKTRKTKGIYRRGQVYWVTYMGVDGKQKFESTGSILKADADLILAQRRLDVDQGKTPISNRRDRKFTFRQLAEKYLPFVQNQKGYSIKKLYVAALVREFGEMKLHNLSLATVEIWQSKLLSEPRKPLKEGGEMRPPLMPASVNKHVGVLKHMMQKAMDWQLISEDVAKRVRKVKITPENNRRLRFLSMDEISNLLDSCEKHLEPIVSFALNTGCRRGEILGLTWDRVDLKHGFILLDETKNGKRREIPINATVRVVLEAIKQPKKPKNPKIQYVFVNPYTENRYYDMKKSFATACEIAGISDFHFHDLRHTFASQLIMAGVDITSVSRLLGHANLTMTLRYAHLAPNHLQNAVDVLSKLAFEHKKTSGHA